MDNKYYILLIFKKIVNANVAIFCLFDRKIHQLWQALVFYRLLQPSQQWFNGNTNIKHYLIIG
jgi:hypothetical protein